MQKKEIIIFSVGGSLIVPDNINVKFLKNFRELILKQIKKNKRFVIITGGGLTARNYMNAANKISNTNNEDMDWLGIHSTRLNAQLIKTIFKKEANKFVIKNPTNKIDFKENILIAAGYKPGCSTDYDAVLIAKNIGAKKLINLSNIDFVYSKDPKKYSDAKKIKNTTWKDFRKILPKKWSPGLSSPFDPIAAKAAEELKLEVVIMNGSKLKNLENYLEGKKFNGTIIKN